MKKPSKTIEPLRKITLMVPVALLDDALKVGGDNLTQTVRKGLQLIAAKKAYAGIRNMKGKIKFSLTLDEMRYDR